MEEVGREGEGVQLWVMATVLVLLALMWSMRFLLLDGYSIDGVLHDATDLTGDSWCVAESVLTRV